MSDIEGEKPKIFLKFAKKNNLGFLAVEYSGHGKSSGEFTKGNIRFVGPICESADEFLNQKTFSKIKEGDYVGLANVGAYGMTLSSNYNARPTIAEIMVSGSKHKIIRKRQTLEDLVKN